MNIFALHLLVNLIILLVSSIGTDGKKCLAIHDAQIEDCGHDYNIHDNAWESSNLCQHLNGNNGTGICTSKSSCAKSFKLTIFDQQLFALAMKNTFIGMLSRCCQKCASCSVVNVVKDNTLVTESILNSSDVIFPVLAKDPAIEMHGFHFLVAYEAPSAYYFSLRKSGEMILHDIIAAYLDLWPFLLVCLLFAFISGFVIWIIECRKNSDFSSHFCPGIFDGLWWSFISMTTVGFGDKVAKTYLGKIFAILWILLGITLFSMLTATITATIIDARSPASTDMAGKDIAVLKGRIHDMSIVVQHGGILHIGSIGHTMKGISELVEMVENRTVHGYLIDKNTVQYFTDRIREAKYKNIGDRLKQLGIRMTEKTRKRNKLECGMLVKDLKDFQYFSGFFDNNRLTMHSCNEVRMNTLKDLAGSADAFLSADSELFEEVLTYTLAIVGFVTVIGVITEGVRYYRKRKKVASSEHTA